MRKVAPKTYAHFIISSPRENVRRRDDLTRLRSRSLTASHANLVETAVKIAFANAYPQSDKSPSRAAGEGQTHVMSFTRGCRAGALMQARTFQALLDQRESRNV
jgi:hypothetical protein